MEGNHFEDEEYIRVDYSTKNLTKGEYDHCSFVNCIFSNSNLTNIVFTECEFIDCDLSTANIKETALRDVKFTKCKLLGLPFQDCNDFLFSVNFDNCLMNLSSFYQRSLKGTILNDCILHEVDFVESDLTNSIFNNCDLKDAIFDNTILEKVDFRTSFNYVIDPENNKIKKAKFSVKGVTGLLKKYNIVIE